MFTWNEDRIRTFSEVGSPERVKYASKIDKKGNIIVEEAGKENLYDYIQSFADSVNIHVLLAKFANGDASALAKRTGTYLDTTEFPQTYADVLNVVNQATAEFDTLPAETRAKFDYDVNKFIATIGSDEWKLAMGLVNEEKEIEEVKNPIEEEVKNDES